MQRNQLKNPANIYPTWSKLQKPLLPSGDQTWQWRTTPGLQQIIFPARNLQVVPAFSSPQCWMTQRRVVNNMFFDGETSIYLMDVDGYWWMLMDVDGCWWTLRLKSFKNPPFTEHSPSISPSISTTFRRVHFPAGQRVRMTGEPNQRIDPARTPRSLASPTTERHFFLGGASPRTIQMVV